MFPKTRWLLLFVFIGILKNWAWMLLSVDHLWVSAGFVSCRMILREHAYGPERFDVVLLHHTALMSISNDPHSMPHTHTIEKEFPFRVQVFQWTLSQYCMHVLVFLKQCNSCAIRFRTSNFSPQLFLLRRLYFL